MALINCPECGKEISDKSETCIHCGYLLSEKNICYINGTQYDLSFVFEYKYNERTIPMVNLMELTGCTGEAATKAINEMFKTGEIPKTLTLEKRQSKQQPQVSRTNESKLTCPRCGLTDITEGTRGFTLTTGFLGSGNFRYVCKNCGNKWKPGSVLETLQRANNKN